MIGSDGIETVKSIYSQNLWSFLEETYLHTKRARYLSHTSHILYIILSLYM